LTELQELKISEVTPSKFNPRKDFGKDELDELADSIRAQGVISPLLVRPIADGPAGGMYEIVAGERRYRAAKLASLKTIPCVVRTMTDEAAHEAQIIENLQRADISALDEAQGFQNLFEIVGNGKEQKTTVRDIAQRVGKSERYVYARVQLLGLSDPIKKALAAGKIEPSHAQELVPLKPEQQKEMLNRIEEAREYEEGMSVTTLREEIKYNYAPKPAAPQVSAKEKARRAHEAELEKKRQNAWKKKQAQSEAQRKLRELVDSRAIVALWQKMKSATAKDRDWFLDLALQGMANKSNNLREAMDIAKGKTPPLEGGRGYDGYFERRKEAAASFGKHPRPERLALAVLAEVIDRCNFGTDKSVEQIFRWAKVDRKAIARELAKQEKEHAENDAAALKKAKSKRAGEKSQTPAKPKPAKKAAQKAKGKK
jgi:ParB family chromosome partitioning protein